MSVTDRRKNKLVKDLEEAVLKLFKNSERHVYWLYSTSESNVMDLYEPAVLFSISCSVRVELDKEMMRGWRQASWGKIQEITRRKDCLL